jgi:hypothetical protein
MTETSSSKARPEDGFLVLRLGRLGVLRDLRGGMMKVCSYKLTGVREQDKLQASKETLTQRRRVRGVNATAGTRRWHESQRYGSGSEREKGKWG